MSNKDEILKKLRLLLYIMKDDILYSIIVDQHFCPIGYNGDGVNKKYIEYWIAQIEYDLYGNEKIRYVLNKCNQIWSEVKQDQMGYRV